MLGITYQNIRAHLVKLVPEPVVRGLETTFSLVKTLVTEGPMAAWEQLKEIAGEMQDAFVEAVKDWIKWKVVEEAVKTILAMFIPGAGIIRAIIGIYDTIVFFIQKAKQIMEMIGNFLGSIAEIAAGNIAAAAAALEDGLARGLKLVIAFLAKFLRLDGITAKIREAIQAIRSKVDAVIEKVAGWIVGLAKKAGRFVAGKALGGDPNAPPEERVRAGVAEGKRAVEKYSGQRVGAAVLRPLLGVIRMRHNLTSLDVVRRGEFWAIRAVVNPTFEDGTNIKVIPEGDAEDWPTGSARSPIPIKWFKPRDGFYPTIRVRGGPERTPRQGITLPAVARTEARELTVNNRHFMRIDQTLRRIPRADDPIKREIRRHLDNLLRLPIHHEDRIFFGGSDDYAVDHVHDMTWEGPDRDTNLWPLAYHKNEAINASHNQQVRVREGSTIRTNSAKYFPDKVFVIKKIATSAPSSSGGHGTTSDHPINSGEGDIPKKDPR